MCDCVCVYARVCVYECVWCVICFSLAFRSQIPAKRLIQSPFLSGARSTSGNDDRGYYSRIFFLSEKKSEWYQEITKTFYQELSKS